MKDIQEAIKDPHFISKVVVCFLSFICCHYLNQIHCFKCPAENMITYGAVVGGLLAASILISSYLKDDHQENDYAESALFGVYGVMNILAAYIFYTKIKSCTCSKSFNPHLMLALGSAATGTCMAADVASLNLDK